MSEMKMKRRSDVTMGEEYGCAFWRILPWENSGSTDEGMALAVVAPGTSTTPHEHDELETFVVVRGEGLAHVEGASAPVGPGDVVAVGSGQRHHFENPSGGEALEILCVWGQPPAGVPS